MTEELSISYTVKIILGLLLIIAVVWGIYTIFRENIIDFFKNLNVSSGETAKNFLALILR
jgi:flagellar biosynthesis protein FliR